jgi:hypothetical protein
VIFTLLVQGGTARRLLLWSGVSVADGGPARSS